MLLKPKTSKLLKQRRKWFHLTDVKEDKNRKIAIY